MLQRLSTMRLRIKYRRKKGKPRGRVKRLSLFPTKMISSEIMSSKMTRLAFHLTILQKLKRPSASTSSFLSVVTRKFSISLKRWDLALPAKTTTSLSKMIKAEPIISSLKEFAKSRSMGRKNVHLPTVILLAIWGSFTMLLVRPLSMP